MCQNLLKVTQEKHNMYRNSSCPPWRYHKFHDSSCECGDSINGIVRCSDDGSVCLLNCHCMSYSDHDGDMMLVGDCPYLCTNYFYTEFTDISDLCNLYIHQNRTGQMCGRCTDNFAPSPYTYNFECSECSNYKLNWIKYIAIAYIPLTVFFLAVIIFRFNALSPSMNLFILVSQIFSCPSVSSLISMYVQTLGLNDFVDIAYKGLSVIYGIWNLDFFRAIYQPFCLHPGISILQSMCLDYVIAVYPLVLVFLVYFLVKLHERFELVQSLWRPAAWLLFCVIQQWNNISNSLIQAFGTFMLLSYIKIINISFDILMPVQLHNVSGQVVGLYVYYNGSLEYLGHEHLPYAVLAIFMFTMFNLMPFLLLCLYPCRCFQSCLNCCRLNSQVLRTFMDAFQGCYKFEPYDCRYWAGFYLFLRIAILVVFAFTQSGYFVLVGGILLVFATSFLLVVRPYREGVYNAIDAVMLLTLILTCFSAAGLALTSFDQRYALFVIIMLGISLLTPPTYATLLLIKTITPKKLMATSKKYLLCILLQREDERLQINESIEEPLLGPRELGDSTESQLFGSRNLHCNTRGLLDYTT